MRQTFGKSPKSKLLAAINQMPQDKVLDVKENNCLFIVHTTSAALLFHDSNERDARNRPYLHIVGSIVQIDGDFPLDVNSLKFEKSDEIPVNIWYEFTDEQIKTLVDKDLFGRGCRIAENLINTDIEIPGQIDAKMVESDLNVPIVVITGIHNESDLLVTEATSGYDLADEGIERIPDEEEYEITDEVQEIIEPDLPIEEEYQEQEEAEAEEPPFDEEEVKALTEIMKKYNDEFESPEEEMKEEEVPSVDPVVTEKVDRIIERVAEKQKKEREGSELPITPDDEEEQQPSSDFI